nr:dolichyl-diphosphooligosaccharide--protein glycosyltransferase subunit 2-like [Tanacetum cinerariifolium]
MEILLEPTSNKLLLELVYPSFITFFVFVFSHLEEAYEAVRTFEVLGIVNTCKSVMDTLSLPSSNSKNLYHALRVNGLLKCKISTAALECYTFTFLGRSCSQGQYFGNWVWESDAFSQGV